ncbi:M56 family metallopeptidase [uncultured Chitinophaga sp.]|uniref:M56 family metallopeptidase n=1 Tax=uncultured Chitinophaga sp. TaxID=339340 RepID=UPI0025ECA1EF|nr:M56 family metallopeptidase [uncultured Chitinophaga sp.]
MTLFITYLLYSSGSLLFFWLVYNAWLRDLSFYRWNRIYLLASLVISLLVPLVQKPVFTIYTPQVAAAVVPMEGVAAHSEIPVSPVRSAVPDVSVQWDNWALVIYLAGVTIAFIIFAAGLANIARTIRNSRHEVLGGVNIVRTARLNASFFHYIFIQAGIQQEEEEMILLHEAAHRRLWHSVDTMMVEVAKIVFWFNPFIYRLGKALKEVHEYEADALVAGAVPATDYAEMLLRFSAGTSHNAPLYNLYSKHPIKTRIQFLFTTKSNNMKKALYLFALPCLALSISSFSIGIADSRPITTISRNAVEWTLPEGAKFQEDANVITLQLDLRTLLGKDAKAEGFDLLLQNGWDDVVKAFFKNGCSVSYGTKQVGDQLESLKIALTNDKNGSSSSATYRIKEMVDNHYYLQVTYNKSNSELSVRSDKTAVIN